MAIDRKKLENTKIGEPIKHQNPKDEYASKKCVANEAHCTDINGHHLNPLHLRHDPLS